MLPSSDKSHHHWKGLHCPTSNEDREEAPNTTKGPLRLSHHDILAGDKTRLANSPLDLRGEPLSPFDVYPKWNHTTMDGANTWWDLKDNPLPTRNPMVPATKPWRYPPGAKHHHHHCALLSDAAMPDNNATTTIRWVSSMKTVWPDLSRCTFWSNRSDKSPNHVSDTRNRKMGGMSIPRATRWCRQTSHRIDQSNKQLNDEQWASHKSKTILE
jgi:hypothetical protein